MLNKVCLNKVLCVQNILLQSNFLEASPENRLKILVHDRKKDDSYHLHNLDQNCVSVGLGRIGLHIAIAYGGERLD